MIADKSTTSLTFFNFFSPVEPAGQLQESEQLLVLSSGRRRLLDLGAWVFSCVTEQLCPESRAAGDPSLPGRRDDQVQAEQLHAIPTAATPAGPRQPEQLFVFWSGRRLGSLPTPNNHSLFAAGTWCAWFKPEQSFGLAARPGWATTRKANNGWFLRVWW